MHKTRLRDVNAPARDYEHRRERPVFLAVLVLFLNFGPAFAQGVCESKAVSKLGKPLGGAAKASFIKKCKRDACESQAVDRNGRRLAGAAKKSFIAEMRAGGITATA
jgi:hypothetical protein